MSERGQTGLSTRLMLWMAGLACLLALASGAAARADEACIRGDGVWVANLCYVSDPDAVLYGHDVLGDTPEWNRLVVRYGPQGEALASEGALAWQPHDFPDGSFIFEDLEPRLFDVDLDGQPEAIVVESSRRLGGRLAVYDLLPVPRLLAATPYIGQRNRWLAPVAIADLNGDGAVELAFVDRPHLARVLQVWTFRDDQLHLVATHDGVTNHRIGEAFLSSGLRECGDGLGDAGPEIVLASGDWSRLVGLRLTRSTLEMRDLGRFSQAALRRTLLCEG